LNHTPFGFPAIGGIGDWGIAPASAQKISLCYACGRLPLAVNGFLSFQSISF